MLRRYQRGGWSAPEATPVRRVWRATALREHHRTMTQCAAESNDYEEWRDLQDALEERDREWWDGADDEPAVD